MVTRRSTPAFAIGGIAWLDQANQCYDIALPIEGRWRCFICDETFASVASAFRHFGTNPRENPRCVESATPINTVEEGES